MKLSQEQARIEVSLLDDENSQGDIFFSVNVAAAVTVSLVLTRKEARELGVTLSEIAEGPARKRK